MKFIKQYRTYADLSIFNQIEANGAEEAVKKLIVGSSEKFTNRYIK